jgi:HPt (histidine-containing phosphotransfer) domain-containing protein
MAIPSGEPVEAIEADRGAGIDTEGLATVDEAAVRALGQLGNGGPAALYSRLVVLFESSSQPVMAQLAAALQAGDLAKASDLCHRLKSSAANVGATTFAAALRELEARCRVADAQAALALHRQLETAYPRLLEALRTRRSVASA